MRNYEVVYVIKPDLEAEAVSEVAARFSQLITDQGGEVIKVTEWGKKRLAYEVRKYREGYYVLMEFKGSPAVAQELERVLKISEDVIRYLITRLEEEAS